jgi:hypothetical protein
LRLPILQLSCRFFFLVKRRITPGLSAPPPQQPRFGSQRLLAFLKAKIAIERKEISDGNEIKGESDEAVVRGDYDKGLCGLF